MRRRGLLGLTVGAMGALAGCAAGWQGPNERGPESGTRDGGPAAAGPAARADVELPVPLSAMRQPLGQDSIPAVVDPVFATDWSGLDADGEDPSLPADAPVVGLERDGRARAYPLRVLDWHEIVNDSFDGPLAVTYCPLCGSSVVVERVVAGEPTVFGVSGKLWRNDLVMYDRATESLWSQLLATAIRGPRTGETLTIVPSTLTTWGEWQAAHPDTVVLLPPPRSNTVRGRTATYHYFGSKYGYEDQAQLIGFDGTRTDLGRRTLVVGVTADGAATAYPFPVVDAAGVVQDRVGDVPVVVATTPGGSLVAYDRRVDGRTRSFRPAGDGHLRAAGSRWDRTSGRAVDGAHRGRTLTRANGHPPMFLEAWLAFTPGTAVYGSDIGSDR